MSRTNRLLLFLIVAELIGGGIVMGRQGIIDAYSRGAGRITLRARAKVTEEAKGKSPSILISEVPFQVTRNALTEEIGQLVKDERIAGISGVRDESSARNGEPVLGFDPTPEPENLRLLAHEFAQDVIGPAAVEYGEGEEHQVRQGAALGSAE